LLSKNRRPYTGSARCDSLSAERNVLVSAYYLKGSPPNNQMKESEEELRGKGPDEARSKEEGAVARRSRIKRFG